MSVQSSSGWNTKLTNTGITSTISAGAANFSAAIGSLTNDLQVNPGGSVGFITFDQATFTAALLPMAPVSSAAAGASVMSSAWMTAMSTSVISPSTVTNAAWTASSTDVSTAPTGAAVFVNLSAAEASLFSALSAVQPANNAQAVADAFRNATLMLMALAVGLALAPPGPPVPVPLTLGVS